MGLGGYKVIGLADARERARDAAKKVANGIDPIQERTELRKAIEAERLRSITFAEATGAYVERKLAEFSSERHRRNWISTVHKYAFPVLGNMQVADIGMRDVLRVLEPIWRDKTATASRLRGRIEAILNWATVAGHREGLNPARWAGNLTVLLPDPSKITEVAHHAAVQIGDAPRWFADLQGSDGMNCRALEFLALCASRSGEVRGATWDEIDLETGLWTIPAKRMKMKRPHRVPLSPAALELLNALPRFPEQPLVFPAPRGGIIKDEFLSKIMCQMPGYLDKETGTPATPHGLRSTFRDWVAEKTDFDPAMAEIALAHKINNAVEAAYLRTPMIEKRRNMMVAWSAYLSTTGAAASNVVDIALARG